MAIYKPTDVQPASTAFDVSSTSTDLPVWLTFKLDTNNVSVTAYSVTLYDSENNVIFPLSETTIANTITKMSDLQSYCNTNYPLVVKQYGKNVNSGLNGSYVAIPFIVDAVDTGTGTVKNNQIAYSNLSNNKTYKWNIRLYQSPNGSTSPELEYYDMTITTGTVLGSTNNRIQTVPSDNIYSDYYIQLGKIDNLDSNDVDGWKSATYPESTSIANVGSRVKLTSYDSSFGYIYPIENKLPENMKDAGANVFRIYKNSNDPANLTTQQQVAMCINDNIPWAWKTSSLNESESYGTKTYDFGYSDLPNNGYTITTTGSSVTIQDGVRIALNGQSNGIHAWSKYKFYNAGDVVYTGTYAGSDYKVWVAADSSVHKRGTRYDPTLSTNYWTRQEQPQGVTLFEWSAATKYSLGDYCYIQDGGTTKEYFKSNVANNVGNWPKIYANRGAWKEITGDLTCGFTFPSDYNSSMTYSANDTVKCNGRFYRCVIAGSNYRPDVEGVTWETVTSTPSTYVNYNEYISVYKGYNYKYNNDYYKISTNSASLSTCTNFNPTELSNSGHWVEYFPTDIKSNHNGIFYPTFTVNSTKKASEVANKWTTGDKIYIKNDCVWTQPEGEVTKYYWFCIQTCDAKPGYEPSSSSNYWHSIVESATVQSNVTVNWLRTPDANTWGTLSNKVVYVAGEQTDNNKSVTANFFGANIQIAPYEDYDPSDPSTYPVLNTTKVKFILEKPVDIYTYTVGNNKLVNNTGLIFYNKEAVTSGTKSEGIMYVRPFVGLQAGMRWIETNNTGTNRYCDINSVDTTYWRIKYSELKGSSTGTTSQSVESDKTRYQIRSYYKDGDENVFYTAENPTVTLKCNDKTMGDSTSVSAPYATFSATYNQTNLDMWESYIWVIKKSGKIIYNSEQKYDGQMSYDVYGLENGTYTVELIIYMHNGKKITTEKTFSVSFEATTPQTKLFDVTYDCMDFDRSSSEYVTSRNAAKIALNSTPIGAVTKLFVMRTEKISSGTYQNHYKPMIFNDAESMPYTVYDYSVLNNRTYKYLIYYEITNNGTAIKYYEEHEISTGGMGWTITELHPTENENEYTASLSDVWKFKYNISPGERAQNISKTQQDNLSQFPIFSHGPKNSISGSVSCLLGKEIIGGYKEQVIGEDYDYISSNKAVDMLDNWNEICYSGNPKLLKDQKGHGYIVQIHDSSAQTEESWTGMPDTISFSWTQIADVEDVIVHEEKFIVDALCFTAGQANSTVELIKIGSPSIGGTAYSTDGKTWTTFTPSTVSGTNRITLANFGDRVYFVNNIMGNFDSLNRLQFVMSGQISASGNVNSLYVSENYGTLTALTYSYCYYGLFHNCVSLIEAPENLRATVLSDFCYCTMFGGCTSLTRTPEFSAVQLANDCYNSMFANCNKLTKVVCDLSSTILKDRCYQWMFYNCNSLETAPRLLANTLAALCYQHMFEGCVSLIQAPEVLPAQTLYANCYGCMFRGCKSLQTPPAIRATTLAESCCRRMFAGCAKMIKVPALASRTAEKDCYGEMFSGCSSLIVSDSETTTAKVTWKIPSGGAFTNKRGAISGVFTGCPGTRNSNDISPNYDQETYYVINQPVQ